MEENEDNQIEAISITPAQLRVIKIVALVLIFSLPLIYVFYKASNPVQIQPAPAVTASQPANDIAVLEAKVQALPTADNLVNLSLAYINAKMPGKSIAILNRAAKLSPNDAKIYNNLGVAYTLLQQYQNGIDACTKALQVKPDFQLAKNNLKWASDERNKVVAAITQQEQITEDKRDGTFYINYATNYFKIGDYDKTIAICNTGLSKESKNIVLINECGIALVMKKQYDNAITEFSKVLQVDPNNQLAKNNIAWANSEKTAN